MKKIIFICSLCCAAFTQLKAQVSLQDQYIKTFKQVVNQVAEPAKSSVANSKSIIEFSQNLLGIPYRYASSNPSIGFDCSGFVSYVYKNFNIQVPRSSKAFYKMGKGKTLANAEVGDVLVFTGSNSRKRTAGHVGILLEKEGDKIKFIHSSSGNKKGVVITEMDKYYKNRFLKAVSVLE